MLNENLLPLFDEIYIVKEKENSIQIKYSGNNQKHMVILYDSGAEGVLNKADKELFDKIIFGALGLQLTDIAAVDLAENKTSFADILSNLSPLKIIIWGCDHFIPDIQVHQALVIDGCNIIKAYDLKLYHSNDKLKGELWL